MSNARSSYQTGSSRLRPDGLDSSARSPDFSHLCPEEARSVHITKICYRLPQTVRQKQNLCFAEARDDSSSEHRLPVFSFRAVQSPFASLKNTYWAPSLCQALC